MPDHDAPLPTEAVRDLLGIVRAMYATRSLRDFRPRLATAGKALAEALKLALANPPGSAGHRQAWELAEKGMADVGRAYQHCEMLAPTLYTAVNRVRGPYRAGGE